MNRRQLLGVLGGGVAGLAGCLTDGETDRRDSPASGDSEDDGTDDPADGDQGSDDAVRSDDDSADCEPLPTVGYRVESSWTGNTEELEVADGHASYRWECYDPENRQYVTYEHETEFTRTDRLCEILGAADPESWKGYYDCTPDACATDAPSHEVWIERDGARVESGYYGGRLDPVPDGLAALSDLLAATLRAAPSPCWLRANLRVTYQIRGQRRRQLRIADGTARYIVDCDGRRAERRRDFEDGDALVRRLVDASPADWPEPSSDAQTQYTLTVDTGTARWEAAYPAAARADLPAGLDAIVRLLDAELAAFDDEPCG
jgi:hypothetical protein